MVRHVAQSTCPQDPPHHVVPQQKLEPPGEVPVQDAPPSASLAESLVEASEWAASTDPSASTKWRSGTDSHPAKAGQATKRSHEARTQSIKKNLSR
jgi:hypothetical protein